MGRILTNRYNYLFEKKGIKAPVAFITDIYRSGKTRELISFLVWEAMHKLHLFPKDEYLKFNPPQPVSLDKVELGNNLFHEKLKSAFESRNLKVSRLEHDWKLMFISKNGDIYGCLSDSDNKLYKSTDNGESIKQIGEFPEKIKSIFISSQNTIFVCITGALFRSLDEGNTFTKSLELGSEVSFFRHNNGMTETPLKMLIVAEYGNIWENNTWRKLAYLYFSSDEGETWETSDFLIKQGVNKHVHLVKYSKLIKRVLVADGDNHKKLWISDPIDSLNGKDIKWNPVNQFHIQMGGYTSIIESDGKILFGTDYQGGTNFIIETVDGKKFTKGIIPDPYRRSPIDNMVVRKSRTGEEIWANLPYSTPGTRCSLMYSNDNGESWHNVIDYIRSKHKIWLISSAIEPADDLYFSIEAKDQSERMVFRVQDLD